MENKNCFGCRFALESREYKGEIRCAKAEQLFGGKRWVQFKEVATCGNFEPFQGDESRAPDLPEETPEVKIVCNTCKGTGYVMVPFVFKSERTKCPHCVNGKITKGGNN